MLLVLDPEPFEIARRAVEAELASIRQEIESKRSEYRRSLIDIALAKKRIAYLKTQHDRKKKLRARGVSSVAQLDEATFQLRIAEEELHAVEETRRKLLTDLGGDLEVGHAMRVCTSAVGWEMRRADLVGIEGHGWRRRGSRSVTLHKSA